MLRAARARLVMLDAAAQRAVAQLIMQADGLQLADERFCRELHAWLRPARDARDGISGSTIGVGNLLKSADRLHPHRRGLRYWKTVNDGQLAARAPLIAVLVTAGDAPRDWMGAGHALERVLLEAAARGLSVGVLNQAVQVAAIRDELQAYVGVTDRPQMLLRIGHGPAASATPRRPVDVLVARASSRAH